MKSFLFAALLWLVSPLSLAEVESELIAGDYRIHYSLFNSSFISPEVASAYGLTRGKRKAIVNISVRKNQPDGADREHPAIVNGTVKDLIHSQDLTFIEVREQGAIYYLAELPFNDKETLYFDLQVSPDRSRAPYNISFQRKLYVE